MIMWEHNTGQEGLSDFFSQYGSFILVAILSAMTIFRREMSCNHCYVEQTPSREDASSSSSSSSSGTPTTLDWDEEEAEEILEGAGRYCSGAFIFPFAWRFVRFLLNASSFSVNYWLYPFVTSLFQTKPPRSISVQAEEETKAVEAGLFSHTLPLDAQMHILSYLSPKDLVNVACVSRSSRKLIDEGETSYNLWKNAFCRDYAWLLENWEVGVEALNRSGVAPSFSKDFYFRFGISFINYLLAGQNTFERCLVGIGGHIYDLSLFLHSHPGSPETVMAHAGMDSTMFFTGVNHSMGARRLAQSLCVAVDLSFVDREYSAVRPVRRADMGDMLIHNSNNNNNNGESVPSAVDVPETFHSRTVIRHKGTLKTIREQHQREEIRTRRLIETMEVEQAVLGDINIYYDPVHSRWKAWYTSTDLENVFIDRLPNE